MSKMTLTLEQIVRACGAHEVLLQNHVGPDGGNPVPLKFAEKVGWNIAKNLRILRAEKETYDGRVRAIANEEISKFYADGRVPPQADQTAVDRKNIATIDAAYAPRVRELNATSAEVDGLLKIPCAGLNLDKNKNFPNAVLPDLFDFIDGEPSVSAS